MESKISMQEEIPELEERVEEEDDDGDGPPPGFQCIVAPQHQAKKDEADDEEDEGPPPGFHSTAPKPSPALHSSDANVEGNAEVNEGESDSDDEGPPPGWEKVLHHQMPPSCTPPLQPSQAVSSDSEMWSKQETSKNNDEFPQSESQLTPLPLVGQSLPPTPQLQQLPPSASLAEARSKEETKDVDKMPTSVPAASPKHFLLKTQRTWTKGSHLYQQLLQSNMSLLLRIHRHQMRGHLLLAQLVCGTCRKLLLYPRGAKWVQCPGCQEVNFVLEANEVGQVKCGNCALLLMYPFRLLAALSPKLVQTTGDLLFQFKWPRDVDGRIKAEHVRLLKQDENSNSVPFKFVFQAVRGFSP